MTDDASQSQTQNNQSNNAAPPDDTKNMENRDIKWRERYKVTFAELENLKARQAGDIGKVNEQLTIAQQEKASLQHSLVDAELKAQAIAEGVKDLDLVKLIDKNLVKIGENGKIEGIKEAVAAFKTAKPDFFGSKESGKKSTSKNSEFPEQNAVVPKQAADLTAAEWEANKDRFMQGDFSALNS